MKNIFISLAIMLTTLLFILFGYCGCGGDSSSRSDAPQLDSALFGRWEGITEHSGHDCPTFMHFYSNGRIENYWLDPDTDVITGGLAGTYSASGGSITVNITDGWNPEGLMNWDDFPDELNTGTYTISGYTMTLITEHDVMTFYNSIDPALFSDMDGIWIYTDGPKIITLTLNYDTATFSMLELDGGTITDLEQGDWDIYMSVETGGPSGEYLECVTTKFRDYEDADEDGDTTEMLNSFIYRRFSYTLDTDASPDTLTLESPAETMIFVKDE